MMDFSLVHTLSVLGLKPTEVLILAMLWQNIKHTKALLGKLVLKINRIDARLDKAESRVKTL